MADCETTALVPLSAEGRGARLLDVDPELGAGLDPAQFERARRHALLPTITFAAGPWSPAQLAEPDRVRGEVHGFMVLEGALTIDVALTARRCVRLIAPGELLLLDGLEPMSLEASWGWSALTATRLLVFDDRLLAIATHWPTVMSAVLRRAAGQTRQTLLQQAISQLPRVEERLLALFWSIADRNGTVRSDGILIDLPLTHQILAEMIGAQRPTVSLGLTRLAELGRLRSGPHGWLLDPASAGAFAPPVKAGTPLRTAQD